VPSAGESTIFNGVHSWNLRGHFQFPDGRDATDAPLPGNGIMPCARQRPATETPASCAFKIPMIRPSVQVQHFIHGAFDWAKVYLKLDQVPGGYVSINKAGPTHLPGFSNSARST
jgi:hypothetical protein